MYVHERKGFLNYWFLNYGFLNLQIPETTISESTDVSVHGVKKPFNCFPKWDKLKRHDSSVHEGKKPFKCDISNFHCSQKANLKKHVAYVHERKGFLNYWFLNYGFLNLRIPESTDS